MTNLYYYVLAALLAFAFALRMPGLLEHRRDPFVRAVSLLLPLASAVFFFAAPPTISWVNELTGTANFSAPVVYGLVTALSAALVNLMITWRGGPEQQQRAATRWCFGVYAAVIAALFTLFALGETPEERLLDFDTHYAKTPYIREMIVLYIAGHALSTVTLAVLCWRWSREVPGLLRIGLVVIVAGSFLSLIWDACKLLAVTARWTGHDWDTISTTVAPTAASLATLTQAIGLLLPSVGQSLTGRWHRWSQYRRLRPLWLTMRAVTPYGAVGIPWWSPLSIRHLRRTILIRDGLRLLGATLDHRDTGPRAQEPASMPDVLEPDPLEPDPFEADPFKPESLRPESDRHVSTVLTALATLPRSVHGQAGSNVESVLAGDDDGLVMLSDAIRVLTVRDERTLRRFHCRPDRRPDRLDRPDRPTGRPGGLHPDRRSARTVGVDGD
ncbi:MAB_1171c family putative transporter [Streptomyces sp. NPDC057939]|uniref:MAB_1171c family putative transporter n=1 Tax=Streptomyces sp. NPDC057939 TaxID=3346284 RepID=UPI0036E6128B